MGLGRKRSDESLIIIRLTQEKDLRRALLSKQLWAKERRGFF